MSALSPISGFSQITHVPSVLSYNPYPYYDYTAEGPSHQPPDNFNTGGFMCKSGLCGGGGAANSMSYLSYSMCSYDPYTGHGGGQNYCCNNEAKAAGCTKPCDKTTGDCTTKSMPGETCSTSADCFNDGACLSGRCCAFAACDHNGGHYPGCLATKINRGIGTRAAPSVATPRRLTTPGWNDPACARRAVGTSAC